MSKLRGKVKSVGRWGRDGAKEREWRELIAEQRRGGESVRAFCLSRRLHETSFYYWRREIELRDREAGSEQASTATSCRKTSPLLAPVVFVDEPRGDSARPRDVSAARQSATIEIVLEGGTTVRVPPHSTPEQLGMVLSVLEQARC